VLTGTWVYTRRQDRLRIERHDHAQGVELILIDALHIHRKTFDDPEDLIVYHALLERTLTEARWRFEQFTPERRAGHERRTTTRVSADRRGLVQWLLARVR